MRRSVLSLVAVLALTASACSSSNNPQSDPDLVACSDDAAQVLVAGETDAAPVITVPEGLPPCELVKEDVVVGTGETAVAGATISAHYRGVLWDGGTEFDASWNRGEPLSFTLGAGQVIQGWDQGIDGMKVGGRRALVIPSELGYGEAGSGDSIPADATLVFVVDLVDVTQPEPPTPRPACEERKRHTVKVEGALGAKPTVKIPAEDPPCDLAITDLTAGTGTEAASGKSVSMQYVGVAWSTKKQFDASWDRGQTFDFTLGTGGVIAGWDEGIVGMKVGGRRLLVIPPEKGYGAAGAGGGVIAPNETLVFVVDLISVK